MKFTKLPHLCFNSWNTVELLHYTMNLVKSHIYTLHSWKHTNKHLENTVRLYIILSSSCKLNLTTYTKEQNLFQSPQSLLWLTVSKYLILVKIIIKNLHLPAGMIGKQVDAVHVSHTKANLIWGVPTHIRHSMYHFLCSTTEIHVWAWIVLELLLRGYPGFFHECHNYFNAN